MKVTCLHKLSLIVLMCYFSINTLNAQRDTLYIYESFTAINLNQISKRYSSNDNISINEAYNNSLSAKNNHKKFTFFNINEDYGFLSITVSNKTISNQKIVIEIYNSLINEISFYEKKEGGFEILNKSGTDFPFVSRQKNDRNLLYPLLLKPSETKSYIFRFKKNKVSIVVPGKVWSEKEFQKHNKLQYLFIGLYFGLCFISILISLFIFYVLRKSLFILYTAYIISLSLYLSSYLGLFFQYFLSSSDYYNKYFHVLFTASSLSLFILFSVKVLNAKKHAKKLTKFLILFLITTIIIRFGEFYLPKNIFLQLKPFVIQFWYLSFLIVNIIVVLLIIRSYKHQKKITLFFAISYSFLGLGSIITIINLSTGFINAFWFGMPIIFYASFLEIIFLTFTIIIMVKEIYDERNVLSKKLVHQQQKFLTAFIDGQDKERERIGRDLHDNVGSRLGNFKRLFDNSYSNKKLSTEIDLICNDVRDLSHQITPSEIKLVGLPSAISDLISDYKNSGLVLDYNCYHFPKKINESIATNLYRIVQETLNNVSKHANASHIDIQLIGYENSIMLTIDDNGKGFNNSKSKPGLGLKNIKSRVDKLNGDFLLDSSINKGTSILITVPII